MPEARYPHALALEMARMGDPGSSQRGRDRAAPLKTEDLRALPEGSVVIRVKNCEVKEMYPARARAYERFAPGEWWILIWKGQPCLVCYQFGTHRFAVIGGPDGWLCEEHKDDTVIHEGIVYGEIERRVSADE